MSKTFTDYLKETEEQNRWVEETYDGDDFYIAYGDMWFNEDEIVDEAEYQGRKVKLGKPMRGDVKKFKVYVKDPKTKNVKKVNKTSTYMVSQRKLYYFKSKFSIRFFKSFRKVSIVLFSQIKIIHSSCYV